MKESKVMKELRKIKRELSKKMSRMSWEEMQQWLDEEKKKWDEDMRRLSEEKQKVWYICSEPF